MYDLIIKNGTVVSPSSSTICDVAIKDDKIVGLGFYEAAEGIRTIDATGKYVMPGVIEAHMHCMAPFQGCLGANTFYQQSVSGAFGGVTMFMDFANVFPGKSVLEAVKERRAEMEESAIDFSVHGKFVKSPPELVEEIPQLAEYGVPTFKMFMTYKKEGVMIDEETMLKVFEKAKEVGGLPMLHCEDNTMAEDAIEKVKKIGDLSWVNFAKTKPQKCEAAAFERACRLAEYVGCSVMVVHTTHK
ncbi:MAG: dihydropyrimidinase, partial [Desulfitobacterium hafniense]